MTSQIAKNVCGNQQTNTTENPNANGVWLSQPRVKPWEFGSMKYVRAEGPALYFPVSPHLGR